MNPYKIKRDSDGMLTENCKENIGVKIGSFDCTANCRHNQNTKTEIQKEAFDLQFVRCPKLQVDQLQIQLL
jgi:hypothetical protein